MARALVNLARDYYRQVWSGGTHYFPCTAERPVHVHVLKCVHAMNSVEAAVRGRRTSHADLSWSCGWMDVEGRGVEALVRPFERARRIVVLGEASPALVLGRVLFERAMTRFRRKMVFAGVNEEWVKAMGRSRLFGVPWYESATVTPGPEEEPYIGGLGEHRDEVMRMIGPTLTEWMFAGRCLHVEAVFNLGAARRVLPVLKRALKA